MFTVYTYNPFTAHFIKNNSFYKKQFNGNLKEQFILQKDKYIMKYHDFCTKKKNEQLLPTDKGPKWHVTKCCLC